jgi:iron(III) transport system ATP-binding protein
MTMTLTLRRARSPETQPQVTAAATVSQAASSETTMTNPTVGIRDLTKTFRDSSGSTRSALGGISLDVAEGEFVVLLGPSGCGKTTLLRCVAGLETPDTGEITIYDRRVFGGKTHVPPESRDLSMVFQSYALWPHKCIMDNVAYPLECRGKRRSDARSEARKMLELVGLGDRAEAVPAQLSGGQQQRVALARAIVAGSRLVLFDEPLSNLDAKVRDRLRGELLELQRKLGFAALYVTHDQVEAMAMADRLVVMKDGQIEQIGSPAEVYERPYSRYVADFLGRSNALVGKVTAVGDRITVETNVGSIEADQPKPRSVSVGDTVTVVVRPEHCAMGGGTTAAGPVFEAAVWRTSFLGGVTEYDLVADGQDLLIQSLGPPRFSEGQRVPVSIDTTYATVLHDAGEPAPQTVSKQ